MKKEFDHRRAARSVVTLMGESVQNESKSSSALFHTPGRKKFPAWCESQPEVQRQYLIDSLPSQLTYSSTCVVMLPFAVKAM